VFSGLAARPWGSSVRSLFLAAVISRIAIGVLATDIAIVSEGGSRISPLHEVSSGDYLFYKEHAQEHFRLLARPIASLGQSGNLREWLAAGFVPGPLLPWLLHASSYPAHPWGLASAYLLMSALLVFGWALHYRRAGVSLLWQYALLAMPLVAYYSLLISTDLLFAVVVFCLYSLLKRCRASRTVHALAVGTLVVGLLIRPNALALAPAVAWSLVRDRRGDASALALLGALGAVVAFFTLYYAPYFLAYKSASSSITYWGVEQSRYMSGLFGALPQWLDQGLSRVLLALSKIVYASGLRPSYSGTPLAFVFLRAITAVWLLPGLWRSLARGSPFERVLILCFLFPFMLGASQERYLVPIAPLLFLHGVLFWKELPAWRRLRTSRS
jgi:hypothetical protein